MTALPAGWTFADGVLAHPDPTRTDLARVAAWAAEWAPPGEVRLATGPESSAALAELAPRAGFRAVGEWLVVPRVERVADPGEFAEELLELWHAVVVAGGAVGFRQEATPGEIRPVLDGHLEAVRGGGWVLCVTREPGSGEVLGFGFWERHLSPMVAHVVHLRRFQVRPGLQGHGVGRVQLAGMHRVARDLGGVQLAELAYRSGTGVGAFYADSGYTEVGRLPGVVRATEGDDRDSVVMMRRLDGAALVAHGGH